MKSLLTKKYLTILVLFLSMGVLFAQSIPTPPNPGPPGFPIDGGLLILSAIALGFGVSKKK
jgi:hypothetical protein